MRLTYFIALIAILFLVIPLPANATTLTLNATVSGYASENTDADWYLMRNAGGEDSGSTSVHVLGPLDALTSSILGNQLRIAIFSFNTSYLKVNSTINSAHLYINTMTKTTKAADPYFNITLTGGKLASNTSIATGDYDGWATYEGYGPSTELANRIEYNSINVTGGSGLNDFTLNAAGLSYIDKQKYTVLYLRTGWQALNQTTPYVSAGQAGSVTTILSSNTTGGWPQLVIDYTPLAPVPVTSFTVNRTDGNASLAIQFTDTSTETPTSWNWSFGDGTYSEADNPVHSYTTPGIYTASLTATNEGGSDVSDTTVRIGVSDPAGWYDSFITDTSSQYGDQNSGFVWDTTNGVLNVSNPNGYDPGKMTFYKTSPFFGGTYSYNVTPKMFDSLRTPSGEHYAEFIYGAQERYQGNFYENGTLQAIYFKNSSTDDVHDIVHVVSVNGVHKEMEYYPITVQKDHTYNITIVWNPYSATNVSEIYIDNVLGMVSTNKSGNATGWAGFSVHHYWQSIDWYDNFRINNNADIIPRVYSISDPTNQTQSQYLPDTAITLSENDQVNITSAKGEYESGSFVLHGNADITGVNISTPTLISGGDYIPPSAIDIKILFPSWNIVNASSTASWDIGGSTLPYSCSERWLSNSNLWHNETKFARNDAACSNYLLVRYNNGTEGYQNISSETDSIPEDAVFDDSATIQPFTINATKNKQFWITINVSPTQATGNYSGVMSMTAPGGAYLKNVTLNARIRNFALSDSTRQYSAFTVGFIDTGSKVSALNKSAASYASDLADMRKHGITHPFIGLSGSTLNDEINTSIETRLTALNQSGLPKDAVYFWGYNDPIMGNVTSESDINARVAIVNYLKNRATYYGFAKTYIEGIDEEEDYLIPDQRPVWTSVRLNGSYIFVSGGTALANIADILDTANVATYEYNTTLADEFHVNGHKILIYAYPESGVPNPEIYRKNYGFRLYDGSYDGAGIWAWQYAWGDPWNHFDKDGRADEEFTLPTSTGSVYTLGAEGFREAADDNRYVATMISTEGSSAKALAAVFSNITAGRLPVDIREQIANQIEYDLLSGGAGTTNTNPSIFNWYCPAGRWCLGPFIIWDQAPLMEAAA